MSWFKKPVSPVATPTNREPSSGFFSTDTITPKKFFVSIDSFFKRGAKEFVTTQEATDSAAIVDDNLKAQFRASYQGLPEVQIAWYGAQGFIGYQACALIAQHWLVNKACSLPGQDAVRNGYEIIIDGDQEADPKILEAIKQADKRFKVRHNLEQFSRFGRIFGIRHALFLVDSDDKGYYEKPFNIDGVTRGSYRGITQIDPYWITPELNAEAAANPTALHFYEPTYWRVNGKRIHRSHFVIMRHREVPDVLKPTYIYGGIPLTQEIYERVYAAERCANESPHLLLTKRATVIHVDMDKVMANQELFEKKMQEWIYFRDNYGIKAVGTEEVIEQFDTALADLDTTIMTQYQIVAAIAEVPATKLLGTTPKGFNATGEYEESSYHEKLESVQTHDLTPLLDRHHLLLMRSEIGPKFDVSLTTNVQWNSLDSKTEKEIAEINEINSRTGLNLINSGAIDGEDERNRIIAEKDSGYTGLVSNDPLDALRDTE